MHTFDKISHLVPRQFPALYREDSPVLVAFVQEYYRWLEQDDNILNVARNLLDTRDIDNTQAEFLSHFKNEFLKGMPDNITHTFVNTLFVQSKRLIYKKILDLYRLKGTDEGFKALFRLLFNEEINIYIPSTDIFKTSDNPWVITNYIEINGDYSSVFEDQYITSSDGGEAYCNFAFTITLNENLITILIIENITGDFFNTSYIGVRGTDLIIPVKGSLKAAQIIEGGRNYSIGDILDVTSPSGINGKARVSDVRNQSGELEFSIIDGGFGYTLNAIVSVTGGGGTGGDFRVGTLSNVQFVDVYTDIVNSYATVALATYSSAQTGTVAITSGQTNVIGTGTLLDTEYAADDIIKIGTGVVRSVVSVTNSTHLVVNQAFTSSLTAQSHYKDISNYGFPSTQTTREYLNTPVISALSIETLEVGTIRSLANVNPGQDYTSEPTITVTEPTIIGLGITSTGNSVWGNDAVITATAGVSQGIVSAVDIIDSGFGFNQHSVLTMQRDGNDNIVTGSGLVNGIGRDAGKFVDTKSFLDNNKKLQDMYYYQEFSYEIQSSYSPSVYEAIVYNVMHQAGTKMFGKPVLVAQYLQTNNYINLATTQTNTFSRASSATYFGADGTLQIAANNEQRFTYNLNDRYTYNFARSSNAYYINPNRVLALANTDELRYTRYDDYGAPQVLIEPASNNWVTNPQAYHASNSYPTDWGYYAANPGTLTMSEYTRGTEDGIPYIDIRFAGTTSAAGSALLYFNPNNNANGVAVTGTHWTGTVFIKHVGGTWNNISGGQLQMEESDDGVWQNWGVRPWMPNSTARLVDQRGEYVYTIQTAGSNQVVFEYAITWAGAVAIDITLRFALPQLEFGTLSTSPMFNSNSTIGMTSRAADILTIDGIERTPITESTEVVNYIRNPRADGSNPAEPINTVVGAYVHPIYWADGGGYDNVTSFLVVAGKGVEDGIPYVDYRFFGAAGYFWLFFDSDITSVIGDTWTASVYCRIIAGNMEGFSNPLRLQINERNGAFAFIDGGASYNFAPTTDPLKSQRYSVTHTCTNNSTNSVMFSIAANITPSANVDITLRFGIPNVTKTSSVVLPILPAVGTVGIQTRAADIV